MDEDKKNINTNKETQGSSEEIKRFTIISRERIDSYRKTKHVVAIIAGGLVLGAITSIILNMPDISMTIQEKLSTIYSSPALTEFFQHFGSYSTLLSFSAISFCAEYLKISNTFKKIQKNFIEMNDAMNINNNIELDSGGMKNDL